MCGDSAAIPLMGWRPFTSINEHQKINGIISKEIYLPLNGRISLERLYTCDTCMYLADLHPELIAAICKHIVKQKLEDIEPSVLICCETTITTKKQVFLRVVLRPPSQE